MQNYVCWRPNDVFEVINAEAEAVPDYVFRAVHSDQTLMCAPPSGARFQLRGERFTSRSQKQFLDFFLNPEQTHVQVVVFGRSGSGKSHLIHWLKTAIPDTPTRLVLTIPKSGTSLRSVVTMIIDRLPGEAQAVYRDALQRAGDSTRDRSGQKHDLLNQIAQAVREETVNPNSPDAEELEALVSTLPDLFQDAYIRQQYFMSDDNIIGKLVDHVFARKTEYQPQDTRQQFRPEDFPSGGKDWRNASEPARQAIQVLSSSPDRMLPLAAAVVNRALDGSAIARAFGFTGDRVIELMDSLRTHLRLSGRELVLLIEDLAQLQGIDKALLQALLNQGSDKLCNIRWAFAATTGIFESIADTVYTRLSLLVDMDHSVASGSSQMTKASLARFAGRYLNATRVGPSQLKNWSVRDGGDIDTLPNACQSCPYMERCHEAFGRTEDGFGNYPLTDVALWNMMLRADDVEESGFNPRILQNNILKPILDTYAEDLLSGTFPPKALATTLGGDHTLNMLQRDELRRAVPREDFDRSLTFQELWYGTPTLQIVPQTVREAFNLPELSVGAQETVVELLAPIATRPNSYLPPTSESQWLKDLDDWEGGKSISQTLAGELRDLIFEAIASTIDWDAHLLQRSFFAGAKTAKPFRSTSISFVRQQTQLKPNLVQLIISPEDTGEGKAGLACRGLLLAKAHGSWAFGDGTRLLVALEDCLDFWSSSILEQIRHLIRHNTSWDGGTAALELLAIGCCLANMLRSEFSSTDILNAVVSAWPDESGAHTPELKAIYKRIKSSRETLVALFRATNSGTKGGTIGAFIDPAVIHAINALRRGKWSLRQVPPEESIRGEWGLVAKIYRETAIDLATATKAEYAFRIAWLAEMRVAFGNDAKRNVIVDAAQAFAQKASELGVGGKPLGPFWQTLEGLRTIQLDDAIKAAEAIEVADSPGAVLPLYGRTRANAFALSRGFAEQLSQLVQNVRIELETRSSYVDGNLAAVNVDLSTIEDAIVEINRVIGMRER